MLGHLTFRTTPLLAGAGDVFKGGKRGLERELLKQKIQSFQSRVTDAMQKTDKIDKELGQMNKTTVRLQKHQDELKVAAKAEDKQLTKVEHMKRSITVDIPLITFNIDSMFQIWNRMLQFPPAIRQGQAAIKVKMQDVDQKQQMMRQQALVIKNNGVAIGLNLLAAAKKSDLIQQQAIQINDNLDAIGVQAKEIEVKHAELQEQVEVLQELQQQALNAQVLVEDDFAKKEATIGFWTVLVQKVMEYSSWFFSVLAASLVRGGIDIKKWLAFHHIRSPYEAINHPASWVAIGALACAIVKNTLFTIVCLSVECSLFYYRWQQNAEMITAAKI